MPPTTATTNPGGLTLFADPKTDIFASPTIGYHFSSPVAYTPLPTFTFLSIRATISFPFTLPPSAVGQTHLSSGNRSTSNPTLHFDQAGLLFVLPRKGQLVPGKDNPGDKNTHPRWIKAGVEVWNGEARGSIVVRERWSDWSLFEVPGDVRPWVKFTIEMERLGDALMIYSVNGNERVLVRKVPWCFLERETEETIWVGVYGARPDPFNEARGLGLECVFEGLDIRTTS